MSAGELLAAEAARFAGFGWMRGTSGNLSVVVSRDPLRLAITGSQVDKGELTTDDILVVDERGVPVRDGAGPAAHPPLTARPSAETALHIRIARLTGAGAVAHLHTVASVLAAACWPAGVASPRLEMMKALGIPGEDTGFTLPVIANSQDMGELGDRAASALLPSVPALIVADHGMYAWGSDLRSARHHAEATQWILEYMLALNGRLESVP